MERLTQIVDPVEPPYTDPCGHVPDSDLSEKMARLWLLSQSERSQKMKVEYDTTTERWERAGFAGAKETVACATCGKRFVPAKAGVQYHSSACRQKAYRDRNVTVTGRLIHP